MAELSFQGFPRSAFEFYEELAENNEKAWFEAHREEFEEHVRAPLASLLEATAQEFGGTVKLSRPHRDVRFLPDKSPYRQNLFGVVHSRPGSEAGYYASIDAHGVTVGTGYYEMAKDQLARFREALEDDARADRLRSAIAAVEKVAQVRGRALKTAPRGFAKDHPNIELIRMKEIVALASFEPKRCAKPAFLKDAFKVWRSADAMVEWLDRHVGASELAEEERFARR